MEGMGAMNVSLGNSSQNKELSLAQAQWPAIKASTIKNYEDGFKQALAALKNKQ